MNTEVLKLKLVNSLNFIYITQKVQQNENKAHKLSVTSDRYGCGKCVKNITAKLIYKVVKRRKIISCILTLLLYLCVVFHSGGESKSM